MDKYFIKKLIKKVVIIIGMFSMGIGLIGLATSIVRNDNSAHASYANTNLTHEHQTELIFDIVYCDGSYNVLQDKQTDVLYLLVDYRTGYTVTPLLNPDGTPRTSMSLQK